MNFKEDYKNLIYQYFSDKIEIKKKTYQESASLVLEEIVTISKRYKKNSNSILHNLLYVYDRDKKFTDVYSASKDILLLKDNFENLVINPIKEFSQKKGERNLTTDSDKKTTPLQWVTENRTSLLINCKREQEYNSLSFFTLKKGIFTLFDDAIFDMSFLKFNDKKIIDFLRNNFLEIPSNWLLIVPMKRSFSTTNKIDVLGVGMFYLGKDFSILKNTLVDFSYEELKESKKALSILSEIASEYHSMVEYEKAKVLEGVKDLSGLYLHSFSQYGSRIEENLFYDDNDNVTLDGFTLENIQNIKQVQVEIEQLKNKLVSRLKQINFDPIKLNYTLTKYIKSKKIQFLFGQKNIIFSYYFNLPEEIKIHFDESVLIEILFTIIDNSIKAVSGKERKIISISVSLIGKYLKISISDNGVGVIKDIEKAHKIFHTQSMSGWENKSKEGSGTGLFLCRVLLSLFSGEIYFEKIPFKNMSTTVSIKIPISKEIN